MVEEAACGIVVKPENPQDITNAIKKLKDFPAAKIKELGDNGKQFVLKNHDYKILAKRFEEIMLNL